MFQPNILLSICCLTYNHENYIRECLNGILLQKTNFNFELIIHDDASSDNTIKLINDITNSTLINVIKIFQSENQYSKSINPFVNFMIEKANGKYVAICEGDDYWVDPYKLQKQIDFLENNNDYSMCVHSVDVKNETKGVNYCYPIPEKDVLNFKDILFKHYIPTCSLVFKKNYLPQPLPSWMNQARIGDIPLELFLADKGKIKYINSKMAVYRYNSNSLTNDKEHIKQGRKSYDFLYKKLRNHFKYKYYILFTLILIKNKIGFLKDFVGLNPLLKRT